MQCTPDESQVWLPHVTSSTGESDISEIIDAVPKITAKYRQFGIGLGVLPGKIDEIEKQRKTPSSVRDKLSEVITVCLGQLPAPTWKTFIDAAKPINRALAESMCRKEELECPDR